MGCDIHIYIEYREDKGPWKLHPKHQYEDTDEGYINQCPASNRNYSLFGILAEVRGNGCIYPQRGLPKDISPKLKAHMDKWLEHSPHWLTLSEFQKCLNKYDKLWKKEAKQQYKRHVKELADGMIDQEYFDRVWKDDPDEKKKIKIDDIFYEYSKFPWKEYIHPSFEDIIPYLDKYQDDLVAEYVLLEEDPPKIEFRLVFYFDS